jgi:hypothetical protein
MEGEFVLLQADPATQAAWIHPEGKLLGLFNTQASTGNVPVCLPDGVYADVLNEIDVEVQHGRMPIPESAAILRTTSGIDGSLLFSTLLDYKRVTR